MSNEYTELKKNKLFKVIFILLIILILAVIGLLYNHFAFKEQMLAEITKQVVEKDSLNKSLNEMYTKYASMKTDNQQLSTQINEEKEKVKKMIDEVNKVKATSWTSVNKYKKETEEMRGIMQHYVRQIDSLYTINQKLEEENRQIRTDFQDAKDENKKLNTQYTSLNNKIAKATTVKAINIVPEGLNAVDKPTNKLNKLFKIRVRFSLEENEFATAGNRVIYLRIARPDDYILSMSANSVFTFEGKPLAYSAKREVKYNKEKLDTELFWNNEGTFDLMPGNYYVDLYMDGLRIGSSIFQLK